MKYTTKVIACSRCIKANSFRIDAIVEYNLTVRSNEKELKNIMPLRF